MGLTSFAGAVFDQGQAAGHGQQNDFGNNTITINNNDDDEEDNINNNPCRQADNAMGSKSVSTVTNVSFLDDEVLSTDGHVTVEQLHNTNNTNQQQHHHQPTAVVVPANTVPTATMTTTTADPTTTANQPKTAGRRLPSMGTVLKYVSLTVLVLMLAVKIMYTRFATVQPHSKPFLKTAMVFWSEVAKFFAALSIFVFFTGPILSAPRRLYDQLNLLDTVKLGVPALVYTVQNFLFLAALENLEASTFSVLDQMKILTTALFTVILLRRRLSLAQWMSLIILMAGVIIVQYNAQEDVKAKANDPALVPNGTSTELLLNRTHSLVTAGVANVHATTLPPAVAATASAQQRTVASASAVASSRHINDTAIVDLLLQQGTSAGNNKPKVLLLNGTTHDGLSLVNGGINGSAHIVKGLDKQKLKSFDHSKQRPLYGLVCVILGNFASGFSGVYVEKMLKSRSSVSIWIQNVQLAALAMPISLAMVAIQDWDKVWHGGGLNQGFDLVVWGVVATQTMSGLCIAVVIKYADNILKTFANSFAIIVISIASIWVFASVPKPLFMVGAAFIITAALLYAKFPYRAKPKADQRSNSNSSTDSSSADLDSNTTPTATGEDRMPTKLDKISRLTKLFRMDRSPTMAQLTPSQLEAATDGEGANGPKKI